jgi:hypothetical protein
VLNKYNFRYLDSGFKRKLLRILSYLLYFVVKLASP